MTRYSFLYPTAYTAKTAWTRATSRLRRCEKLRADARIKEIVPLFAMGPSFTAARKKSCFSRLAVRRRWRG